MKFDKIIDSGIEILCGVLLIFITAATFLQIVLRQFFNFSLNWSDELSQFCMMWVALFVSIWADKNGRQLNTGLRLHQKLNKRLACLIDSVLALLIVGIAAVVAYQSALFTLLSMGSVSLSLGWIKMGYVYVVIPIAMLATCYYYLKSFLKNILAFFKKD
jgi:TRAP-type C4-dicarboxylate transport system permease small subunit